MGSGHHAGAGRAKLSLEAGSSAPLSYWSCGTRGGGAVPLMLGLRFCGSSGCHAPDRRGKKRWWRKLERSEGQQLGPLFLGCSCCSCCPCASCFICTVASPSLNLVGRESVFLSSNTTVFYKGSFRDFVIFKGPPQKSARVLPVSVGPSEEHRLQS